jgi:lysophospholipase L1-like esterase
VPKFALKTVWTLAAVLIAAGGSIVAVFATRFTVRLYIERAELRLNPAQVDHYARDNENLQDAVRPRVVFFGDSRVEWWHPKPLVAGHELVWRGIAGQTTAQMAIRYESDVLALAPSTIVIQAGINDLVAGSALGRSEQVVERLLQNLRAFVARAQTVGSSVCVLTIVPPDKPSPVRRRFWREDVEEWVKVANRQIVKLQKPGVTVIDAASALASQSDSSRALMMADALHFSASGYEFLNSLLAPCFRTGADAVQ